jgi:hypothetical protein
MKRSRKRNGSSATTLSPIPEAILKYARCCFLHEQFPVLMPNMTIQYFCKECNNGTSTAGQPAE